MESVHFKSQLCFCFSNAQLKHKRFIDASAMPTVAPIDEACRTNSPRLDKTATENNRRPARTVQPDPRTDDMNSKLLFAATIAISLASTLALADEAPVTRAQV